MGRARTCGQSASLAFGLFPLIHSLSLLISSSPPPSRRSSPPSPLEIQNSWLLAEAAKDNKDPSPCPAPTRTTSTMAADKGELAELDAAISKRNKAEHKRWVLCWVEVEREVYRLAIVSFRAACVHCRGAWEGTVEEGRGEERRGGEKRREEEEGRASQTQSRAEDARVTTTGSEVLQSREEKTESTDSPATVGATRNNCNSQWQTQNTTVTRSTSRATQVRVVGQQPHRTIPLRTWKT